MLRYEDEYDVVWNGCPGLTGHEDELIGRPEVSSGSSLHALDRYITVDEEEQARRVRLRQRRMDRLARDRAVTS